MSTIILSKSRTSSSSGSVDLHSPGAIGDVTPATFIWAVQSNIGEAVASSLETDSIDVVGLTATEIQVRRLLNSQPESLTANDSNWVQQTWNNAAVTFIGTKNDFTVTNAGSSSKLERWSVNGNEQVSVGIDYDFYIRNVKLRGRASGLDILANGALNEWGTRLTGSMVTSGSAGQVLPFFGSDFPGNGTWSTTGTWLGVNMPSGYAGKIFSFKVNNSAIAELTPLGLDLYGEGVTVYSGPTKQANFSQYGIRMVSSFIIQWTSGIFGAVPDTGLCRNAAGELKVTTGNAGDPMGFICDLYRRKGSGSPEGIVTAPVGAVYHRIDGGAGTSFYVKESGTGNTGWVGK